MMRSFRGSYSGALWAAPALILLGIALVLLTSCGRDEAKPVLQGKGKLYFVPLSDFPPGLLGELVGHFEKKYGLAIETTSPLPLDPSVIDLVRRQVIAEEIIDFMKRSRHDLADDPEAILIGFTVHDMYIRGRPDWRWAFSLRRADRVAITSTARMDPKVFPYYSGPRLLKMIKAILEHRYGITLREPDSMVLQRRLRKMVSKTVGIMYFGLPQSDDRRGVRYGPILGAVDLDGMGEEY